MTNTLTFSRYEGIRRMRAYISEENRHALGMGYSQDPYRYWKTQTTLFKVTLEITPYLPYSVEVWQFKHPKDMYQWMYGNPVKFLGGAFNTVTIDDFFTEDELLLIAVDNRNFPIYRSRFMFIKSGMRLASSPDKWLFWHDVHWKPMPSLPLEIYDGDKNERYYPQAVSKKQRQKAR